MEYSIQALSKLAGVTTRTLRYYDEIGLLKPLRISSSNYRIYGEKEVNLLQQILFYKELDLPLETIKSIVTDKNFDQVHALMEHRKQLLQKQDQIAKLLKNVEHTLASIEGGIQMSDVEKFEGFKKEKIQENEQKYGTEIRQKYGNESIDASNTRFASLTQEEYKQCEHLEKTIITQLKTAMSTGNPASQEAKELVTLHRKWLTYYGNYTDAAHIGLAQMYIADQRFTQYYDTQAGPGATQFLCNAIQQYYGKENS